ncbi:hypothetical protein, partial [Klebsiella michiganensis]|uniref:hypothetical protein n=1 Tax=Klebsiella michiganensis TaxID=1134687 RepID=UPI0007DAC807
FDVFAGKKSAQIREILISESAWEEMTCLFAPSLTVNWKPGSAGQEMLATAAASQKLMQVKVTYFQNIADQDGPAYYSIVNGLVNSDVVNGDFDSVVTRDFVVSVTGAPIAVGEVTGA